MKKSRNEVEQRRRSVIDIISKEENINAEELAHRLNVSPLTIRRDLQYWEDKNKIVRGYGKIELKSSISSFNEDLSDVENRKNLIAKKAVEFIEDGDTVFINTSSTALLILRYLKDKKVNVITNNANAVFFPKDYRVNILLTGGELREPKESMTGEFALSTISKVTANKCIIGCSGITSSIGITTKVLAEVPINELMLKNTTGKKLVLADSSKINHNDSFVSSSLDSIDYLITDIQADQTEIEKIKKLCVEIIEV